MADITIVNGVYKPTYNWGAPSCVHSVFFFFPGFRTTQIQDEANCDVWVALISTDGILNQWNLYVKLPGNHDESSLTIINHHVLTIDHH